MVMNSSLLQLRRATMALNNMGASLLQRGCYQQARDTLQDCIKLTHAFYQQSIPLSSPLPPITNSTSSSSSPCPGVVVQDLLRKASLRLANPRSSSVPVGQGIPAIKLVVLDFSLGRRGCWYDSFCQNQESFLMEAIQIEADYQDQLQYQHQEASLDDLTSAIVLQNFALACFCVSCVLDRNDKPGDHHPMLLLESPLRPGAVRLFGIAYSMATKEWSVGASVHFSLCLHISIVVLSNLRNALLPTRPCEGQGRVNDQSDELASMLMQLLEKAQEVHRIDLEYGFLSCTCAAPAA